MIYSTTGVASYIVKNDHANISVRVTSLNNCDLISKDFVAMFQGIGTTFARNFLIHICKNADVLSYVTDK